MIDNSHNGTSVDIRSSFDRALRGSCVLVLLAAIACGAAIAPPALADSTLTTCMPSAYAAAAAAGGTVTFAVDCANLVPSSTVNVASGKILDIEGNGHMVVLSGAGQRRLSLSTEEPSRCVGLP